MAWGFRRRKLKLNPQLQERLGISAEKIAQLCQQWNITELALFGSVLSDQFHANSDIDILIRFAPNTCQGLLTLAKIKHELEDRIGREVDSFKILPVRATTHECHQT